MSQNLLGVVFGKWTVIEQPYSQPRKDGKGTIWFAKCRCECCQEKDVRVDSLNKGTSKSCFACCPKKGRKATNTVVPKVDLVGRQYGKWTVLALAGFRRTASGNKAVLYRCRCECGTIAEVAYSNLSSGISTGCMECRNARYAGSGNPHYIHGHSPEDSFSPTYQTWKSIHERTGPAQNTFYTERGIQMCERWSASFVNFLEDMGERPGEEYSIDRANKDESTKHYSCGHCPQCLRNGWKTHCRWATKGEQMNNRVDNLFITFQGKTQTATEWSRELNLSYTTIRRRYHEGLPPELILAPAREKAR